MAVIEKTQTGTLRPLNYRKDLQEIADLIELCFTGFLDEDGYDYIRYLRNLARQASQQYFAFGATQRSYAPLQGFVYEMDGQIIGNLSMLPFQKEGEFIYLIANVAVHPDYRRMGIARQLTARALQYAKTKMAAHAWLQVREDNPAAHQLYLSMGFEERTRRTTWTLRPGRYRKTNEMPQQKLIRRRSKDWHKQKVWLEEQYPETVRWNLGLKIDRLKPGILAEINRFMKGVESRNWSVVQNNKLLGVLSLEKTSLFSDNLWIATNEMWEDEIIRNFVPRIQYSYSPFKPMSVNYPVSRAVPAFESAGFTKNHTLIWMNISTNLFRHIEF